jgi:hypothetical protein
MIRYATKDMADFYEQWNSLRITADTFVPNVSVIIILLTVLISSRIQWSFGWHEMIPIQSGLVRHVIIQLSHPSPEILELLSMWNLPIVDFWEEPRNKAILSLN